MINALYGPQLRFTKVKLSDFSQKCTKEVKKEIIIQLATELRKKLLHAAEILPDAQMVNKHPAFYGR
jgi:hypothetical protein